MTEEFEHEPVMADEVAAALSEVPSGLAVDGTVGAGGHARRLLEARPDLRLLALDRDPQAVAAASEALAAFGDRVTVVHAGFEDLAEVVREHQDAAGDAARTGAGAPGAASAEGDREPTRVVAVLLDLGVSSPQVDRAERGFSYRHDAPLDMRMDPTRGPSAAELVNSLPERELARVLRRYGEERHARAVAAALVARRPLHRTGELVDVIRSAVPAAARRTGRHPARRAFQALRIAVNDELANLERGLDAAEALLAPRGRLAVLSYHSLEDRIVKERFRSWSTGGTHPAGLPVRRTERGGTVRLLTRRPLRPTTEEVARNRRAASARLRAVERLDDEAEEQHEQHEQHELPEEAP